MTKKIHTIDASGKKLGRLASEIAVLLMGKNRSDFARNRIPEITIEVSNASLISIDPIKAKAKTYTRYSGYPGGIKSETLEHLKSRRGTKEVLRKAVKGMLPKNKLQARMLKNLIIKD